ncbi:MAG: hypothetical protein WKF89_18490 [Chitinophagaceae bacterium]
MKHSGNWENFWKADVGSNGVKGFIWPKKEMEAGRKIGTFKKAKDGMPGYMKVTPGSILYMCHML